MFNTFLRHRFTYMVYREGGCYWHAKVRRKFRLLHTRNVPDRWSAGVAIVKDESGGFTGRCELNG